MKKSREIWIDCFAGMIPVQNYLTQLDGGDAGFKIVLKSQQIQVTIAFDGIDALQMLDESVDLNTPDGYELDASFWEQAGKHFPSTIYRIENGAFSEKIRSLMGEVLFAVHDFQEYRIVTLNYSISVICQTPPQILINHPGAE